MNDLHLPASFFFLYSLLIPRNCHANDATTLFLNADDPNEDPQARGDPFRTLFVARLSYDVKESDLEREFGRFGPIERVCGFLFQAWFQDHKSYPYFDLLD